MSKINKLTKEQEEYLPIFREKWYQHGISTEPYNKKLAEDSISKFYEMLGKKRPTFIAAGSPVGANLLINFLKNNNLGENLRDSLQSKLVDNLGEKLRSNLVTNLRANLWDNLGENLRNNLLTGLVYNLWNNLLTGLVYNLWNNLMTGLVYNLWDNLLDDLQANLDKKLRSKLWDNLQSNLQSKLVDNLGDNLWDNLVTNLRDFLKNTEIESNYFIGQQDSYWIAHYLFCKEIGIKYTDQDTLKLELWADISKSCGWWYPFENVCIICDRPEKINLLDYQLHSETEPAIKFRDGWEIHAINGHLVPKHVVENPEKITIEEIEKESNAETKRIMIDRFGTGKYLQEIGAKVLDIDSSNGFRSLLQDKRGQKWLEGTDGSTKRIYFMRVSDHVKTCKEAHESICGIDEDMILMQS